MALLSVRNLTMRFGGLTAVSDFRLEMDKGDLVGLIGPNGAGKSTVYNMISGFYRPTSGHIIFDDRDITGLRPDKIAKRGLVRVFQNGRLFKQMTVLENLLVSQHMHRKASVAAAIFHTPIYRREERSALAEAKDLLEKLGLDTYADEMTASLPFGLQRKIEVARALAARPKLLLLDEPATGLTVEETTDMMDFVLKLRHEYKLTILLIEHTMRVVMGICPRILVVDHGILIAEGSPAEIRQNKKVIEAYLGVD